MPIRKVLLLDTESRPGSDWGHGASWEVLRADSADAALALAESARPDVIVLVSGAAPEALGALLQARRSTARIPVIPLSPAQLPVPPEQIQDLFETARLELQLAKLSRLGGACFVTEMIDLFLEHSPKRLDEALRGEAAGNLAAIENSMHSLKSSAGNLGADTVQHLAEQIEALAHEARGDEISPLLRLLEIAYTRIRGRLEAKRGSS